MLLGCHLRSQGDAPVFFSGTQLLVDNPILLSGKVISSDEVVPRPLLPVLPWEPA